MRSAAPARRRRSAPRAYHHGNLRAALVDAATALLQADGPLGVTLRGAARRAGVSQAAPYRHFRDKEALLAAVAEAGFRSVARAGEAAARGHADDPLGGLRAAGRAYLAYATSHPAHYRMMFSPSVRGRAHPALREAAGDAWGRFTAAIANAQRTGHVRAGDASALAFVLWALLHGMATLLVDRQLPARVTNMPVEQVAEFATSVLLEGLQASGRPRRVP